MPDSPITPLRYFVSHNGEVKGPFDLDMIEAFILSGHYSQGVQISAEGSNQWNSHSVAIRASPPPVTPQSGPPVHSKPTGGLPKWALWTGGMIGLSVLIKVFSDGGNTFTSSPSSSHPSTATLYRSVYVTPRPTAYWTPPPFDSTPIRAATPADVLYKDTNGRTYSVPNSAYLRLSKQRAAIDQEEAAITAIQTKQKAYSDSIESERTYLNRTNQYEIDAFNEKIDRLNNMNTQLKARINTFNRSIDAFNAELERVGTPVR